MIEARFNTLLEQGRFEEAASILKAELLKAEFVNPRDDYSWGIASDVLGYRILEEEGAEVFNAYWQDLLRLFEQELEPRWGHLHKGHLYFRLGLGNLGSDLALAKMRLEEALAEDRLVADTVAQDLHMDAQALVERFPSYVTLCILERIDDDCFSSDEDRQEFYQGLVPLRFDVIWDRKEVEPTLVRHALEVIVPEPGQPETLAAWEQLTLASAQGLRTATLSLLGTLVEIVLSNALYHHFDVSEIEGQGILQADLGALLREAARRDVFPAGSVGSTCQLIHILQRELLRPGSREYEYEVNADIIEYIAFSLKVLLDSALAKWASLVG